MKKRLLSLMLCLTMVVTMLTGITIQVSAEGDDLTLIDQSFAGLDAATFASTGWTLLGPYSFETDYIGGTDANGFVIYKNDPFDTEGDGYTVKVSFGVSKSLRNSWIHIGADNSFISTVTKLDGYSIPGYTLHCKGTNYNGSGASYALYKNGTMLTEFTDTNVNYADANEYTITVNSTTVTISGPFANSPIVINDTQPVTSGYIAAWMGENNRNGSKFASVKLIKSLAVDEASNNIPPAVEVDGGIPPTPVKIAFDCKIDGATVNKTNAYLTDAYGNKLSDDAYTIEYGNDEKSIVFLPVAGKLGYKTTYNAVVTTGIKSIGGIALGENKGYPFVTENPPFEVCASLYGAGSDPVYESVAEGEGVPVASGTYTLKYNVVNTLGYDGGEEAYAIVSFEDASGKAIKTVAHRVNISSNVITSEEPLKDGNGDVIEESVTVPAGATVMKSYLVTKNLDKYFWEHPVAGAVISDITPSYDGDTVTVTGTAGTIAGKDVYLMMMNMESATTPYDFDTTVSVGTEFGGEIQKFAKTTTGSNGAFTFTIPMNVPDPTVANWRFYIGGDEFSTAQMKEFYFANTAKKNEVVAEINGSASESDIAGVLNDPDKSKVLGIDTNDFTKKFKETDTANGNTNLMDALALALYNAKPATGYTDSAAFETKLNESATYIAIENDMRDLIVDPATGKITDTVDALIGFDARDTANGVTVTAVFEDENEFTAAARNAVLNAIMTKTYTSLDDIYTDFVNNVMVEGLGCVTDVKEFLYDNKDYFGINLATYNNLDDGQKADVNAELKSSVAMLDATSKDAVKTSIERLIEKKITEFDLSVYTRTFTDNDENLGGYTDDGWELTEPAGAHQKGSFTVDGYRVKHDDPTGSHAGLHRLLSPVGMIADGDYILSANGSRDYREFRYYFNYVDESNHFFITFIAGDKFIGLYKVKDGLSTLLKQSDSNYNEFSNAKVTVEKEGYVTVQNSTGTVILPRTNLEVEGGLGGGRFGVGLYDAPGRITSITRREFLTIEGINATQTENTVLNPTFTGAFTYPVKPSSVNKNTVRILDAEGNIIENAVKSVNVDTNGKRNFTVEVNENVLDYKTDYYLSFTTDIKMSLRDDGTFASEYKIPFYTKAPALNFSKMYDTASGSSVYFTNDMSRYVEDYKSIATLDTLGDNNLTVYMEGQNTGNEDKIVDIYVTIEDDIVENEQVIGTKTLEINKIGNITLTAGGSGCITPSGFGTGPLTTTLNGAGATATAKVKYYVLDANAYTTAYPYVNNSTVSGTEKPLFSLVGEKLIVLGKTNSGKEGKDINIVIEQALDGDGNPVTTNIEKIVGNTKTDANGKYKFDIVLNAQEFTSGTYNIKIGGEEFATTYVSPVNQLIYRIPAERDTMTGYINDRTNADPTPEQISEIKASIETNAIALGVNGSNTKGINVYAALSEADKTAIATKVANKADDFNPGDGAGELTDFIRKAMVIQAYTSGLTSVLYDDSGDFLTDDIVPFAAVNGINSSNVNAYTFYTTNLTEAGKAQVRNGLLNNTYIEDGDTGIDELYKEFIEQTIISGIANCTEGGTDHIYDLITKNSNYGSTNDETLLTSANYTNYTGITNDGDKNTVNFAIQQAVKGEHPDGLLITDIASLNTSLATILSPYVGSTPPSPGPSPSPSPSPGPGPGPGPSGPSGPSSTVGIAGGATIGQVEANMNFTDISGYEWAQESINYLAKKGVVSGDGNGTFRPGDRVKREEFMKMGLLGLEININNYASSSFKDADKDHWAYKIIATAEKNGFTTGRPDGTFGFGEDITREEVATLMYRMLVSRGKAGYASSDVLNGFKDKGEVSDYAVDAISFMVNNGIINGVEADVLAPKSYCTRAQVAKMVYGVMNYLK